MNDLLDPPIPLGADLRHMPSYMIDVQALLDSDLAAFGDPAANWYAVLSWCASLHQVPAGSLPDDDAALAYIVRLGRDVRAWRRYRAKGALKGWVKHADGRLYHPAVTEKVLDLLDKSSAARAAAKKRHSRKINQVIDVATNESCVRTTDAERPQCNRREGKGKEEKGREDIGIAVSGNSSAPPHVDDNSDDRTPRQPPAPASPPQERTMEAEHPGKSPPGQKLLIPPDPPPKKPRAKARTALPDGWSVSDADWSYAAQRGLTGDRIDTEAEKFRNYHLSKGSVMADWSAAWRTWVGNSEKFAGPVGRSYAQEKPSRADSAIAGITDFLIRNGELHD